VCTRRERKPKTGCDRGMDQANAHTARLTTVCGGIEQPLNWSTREAHHRCAAAGSAAIGAFLRASGWPMGGFGRLRDCLALSGHEPAYGIRMLYRSVKKFGAFGKATVLSEAEMQTDAPRAGKGGDQNVVVRGDAEALRLALPLRAAHRGGGRPYHRGGSGKNAGQPRSTRETSRSRNRGT